MLVQHHREMSFLHLFTIFLISQEATKAMKNLNGKMALSKALVVRWANDDKKTYKLEVNLQTVELGVQARQGLP